MYDHEFTKARCIRNCDTLHGIPGGFQIGCCMSNFEVDTVYDLEVSSVIATTSDSQLQLTFFAVIYDGSLDGYDRACGVQFYSIEAFNAYFRIVEEY